MSNPYQRLIERFGVDEIKVLKIVIEEFLKETNFYMDNARDVIQNHVKKNFPLVSDEEFNDIWDYYETKKALKDVK